MEIEKNDYQIVYDQNEIWAYSRIKIPFQAKKTQIEFRDDLRSAVNSMNKDLGTCFIAEYGASSEGNLTDIENALFYNIGVSAFRSLCNEALYFTKIPPNEIEEVNGKEIRYIYHYNRELLSECQKWWFEQDLICEWNDIVLTKSLFAAKPLDYFVAIRQNEQEIHCYQKCPDSEYGMTIKLLVPEQAKKINLSGVIKPLIDGTMCAFHIPQNVDTEYFSNKLGISSKYFEEKEYECLSNQTYIMKYGNNKGMKWNPADEKIHCFYILIERTKDTKVCMSGKIFRLPYMM